MSEVRKLIELEANRKYQSGDGSLMVILESGSYACGRVLKKAWVVRDWRGFYISHHGSWDELLRVNNMEL